MNGSEIVPFTFESVEVRVLDRDGESWWVAADVAGVLGYRMASDATRWLDEDEKGTHTVRTPGGPQDVTVISVSGIFSLILRSRSEIARPFRRWVTHEVLPALRRTGRYEVPGAAPALDLDEAVRRVKALGVARRAGVLTTAEVRELGRPLLAAAGIGGTPPTVEQERVADTLRWVRANHQRGDTFSLRDAWRGLDHRWWASSVPDVEDTLAALVEDGHLRPEPRPERRPGRPPSPRFEVLVAPTRLALVRGTGTEGDR